MSARTYPVNEVFGSLQGEGEHAGRAVVFVRFAGCNLTCAADQEAGFDCDTEFVSSTRVTFDELARMVGECWADDSSVPRVVLTGGEPLLHVDEHFVACATAARWIVHVETNGTQPLPEHTHLWWICVSPKTANHTLRAQRCDELRVVRNWTQALPVVPDAYKTARKFLSPAWGEDVERNLRHCARLCRANAEWSLSVQQHKVWRMP